MNRRAENTVRPVTTNRWDSPTRDRRVARRFILSVPVLFRWTADELERQSAGFTRDVSTHGAYIVCDDKCPTMGTAVALELLLPLQDAQNVGLKLKSLGEVVRLECGGEQDGFAVMAEFVKISDGFPSNE